MSMEVESGHRAKWEQRKAEKARDDEERDRAEDRKDRQHAHVVAWSQSETGQAVLKPLDVAIAECIKNIISYASASTDPSMRQLSGKLDGLHAAKRQITKLVENEVEE